jgi:hypothetical protein
MPQYKRTELVRQNSDQLLSYYESSIPNEAAHYPRSSSPNKPVSAHHHTRTNPPIRRLRLIRTTRQTKMTREIQVQKLLRASRSACALPRKAVQTDGGWPSCSWIPPATDHSLSPRRTCRQPRVHSRQTRVQERSGWSSPYRTP